MPQSLSWLPCPSFYLPPSATVDCCIPPCHPSLLLNPFSLRQWWSLLLHLLAPPQPYCLLPAPLSSTYFIICPLVLLPAVKQSSMLSLPAKAIAQCQAVQDNEIFHARGCWETHLVSAIIFNKVKGKGGGYWRMQTAWNICVALKQSLGGLWYSQDLALSINCSRCLLLLSTPPPLVLSSAALIFVANFVIGWRGWWHCRRIALPPDNNNRDLPFPLFFFQRIREGVSGEERSSTTHDSTQKSAWACHIFPHVWMTKKQPERWMRWASVPTSIKTRPHMGLFLHIRP